MKWLYRNPRGIFPNKSPGEICKGFSATFSRSFSLEIEENPLHNPQQNSNQNLGVSRPKSHCQDLPLSNFSGLFFPAPHARGARSLTRFPAANFPGLELSGADTTSPPCRAPGWSYIPSQLFPQFRVCCRGVAATSPPKPKGPHHTKNTTG